MQKRLFLGVPLPFEVTEAIQDFASYHKPLKGIRWVSPQNLHITTYFLGAVEVEQIENLMELLSVGLENSRAFSLDFQEYCFAPRPRNPRMIWAKYKKHPAFRAIVHQIDKLYTQINPVQQNRKSPIPHITIARLKNFYAFDEIDFSLQFPQTPLPIREIVLWESILTPKGAIYEEMGRFAIKIQ